VFGAGFLPLYTMQPNTTLRLTSVKLTVTSDIQQGGVGKPGASEVLLGITQPHSSMMLEDCVFETACDSPVLFQLLV
jgi:hypothetical protein